MIPAAFDRRWVHPWRRPAEAARPVRLSWEPAHTAPALPQHGPDLLVFGPDYPRGQAADSDPEWCAACHVEWHASAGVTCWNCGRPA